MVWFAGVVLSLGQDYSLPVSLLFLKVDSVPAGEDSSFCEAVTLEQKTSSIGGTSGKVSLWMQWMLPKLTVKLFSPDSSSNTGILPLSESEELHLQHIESHLIML